MGKYRNSRADNSGRVPHGTENGHDEGLAYARALSRQLSRPGTPVPIKLAVDRTPEGAVYVRVICQGEELGAVRFPPVGDPQMRGQVAGLLFDKLAKLGQHVTAASRLVASRRSP